MPEPRLLVPATHKMPPPETNSEPELCHDHPHSTSIFGNHNQPPHDSGGSGHVADNGQAASIELSRKGRACYDGCYCPRYRADIILRPLISQEESVQASSSQPRPIYDRDNAPPPSAIQCDPSSDYSSSRCLKRRPIRNSVSGQMCHRHHSSHTRSVRSSWSWSCVRLLAMSLLVIFSLAALFDVGRCQSVLGDASKGTLTSIFNSTSTPNASKIIATDRRDHQNRKDRHRLHPRAHHLNLDEGGNRVTNGAEENEDEKQQRLSKAAFRQLSRMAFKALISEDFQDRPLRPPDEDGADGFLGTGTEEADLTADDRRQIRRQQRKLERQRQRQLRRQQMARRLEEDEKADGGDLLPPPSDYNQQELVDQQDGSSSADQNDHRLPGRRRAIAIATKDSIKPDSCRTVPLKQRVRMTGCATKIVVNNFCYGQCNSFYIPKLSKKRLRAAFESCSVCRPKTYVPVAITLHCPSRNPPFLKRKIMKVKDCSCMPASVSDNDIPQA